MPNLLVKEIATSLDRARALKMYVCNVAGQPGETEGYSVADHLNVMRHYAGTNSVDIVIANNNLLQGRVPASVTLIPPNAAWQDRARYVAADVIDESIPSRHDPAKIAAVIADSYQRYRGGRRGLPHLWRNFGQRGRLVPGTAPTTPGQRL